MQIKVAKQPQLQKVLTCSFESLKKECMQTGYKNSTLTQFQTRQNLNSYQQYLQVNYLNDFVYKVSPQKHTRIPLLREEQNFREYMFQVKTDSQKLHQVSNQIKHRFFTKNHQDKQKIKREGSISIAERRNRRLSIRPQQQIYSFDPIEYVEEKNRKRQRKLMSQINKEKQLHSFTADIRSVKYIPEAPEIKEYQNRTTSPLPQLNIRSSGSFFDTRKDKQLRKTQYQISNSIVEILQKSAKYQSQQKMLPKRLKNYKSRNQLKKDTDRKIKTQRNKIMGMIQQKNKKSKQKLHKHTSISLNQIPAKQKYSMDYVSYMRTKTKDKLDKYIYEKLVKKPQKDLQKFQEFLLKQVKFQNQQNKHKIQRFFINMREEFRRVEKYTQGSKMDWRSKLINMEQAKKNTDKTQENKTYPDNILQHYHTNNEQSQGKFSGKRLTSKADRIMQDYVRLKNQQIAKKALQLPIAFLIQYQILEQSQEIVQQVVEQQEQQVVEQRQVIIEPQQQIREQQQEIVEQEQQVAEQEQRIVEKEQQIIEQEQKLQRLS